MSRHEFDPVSLIAGLVFAGIGLAYLVAGDDAHFSGRVVLALGVTGLGVAAIAGVVRRMRASGQRANRPVDVPPSSAAPGGAAPWSGTGVGFGGHQQRADRPDAAPPAPTAATHPADAGPAPATADDPTISATAPTIRGAAEQKAAPASGPAAEAASEDRREPDAR